MDFKTYWDALDEKGQAAFAKKVGVSVFYLYLISRGHKEPGPKLAIRMEEASGGEVNRSRLRSDLWPVAA